MRKSVKNYFPQWQPVLVPVASALSIPQNCDYTWFHQAISPTKLAQWVWGARGQPEPGSSSKTAANTRNERWQPEAPVSPHFISSNDATQSDGHRDIMFASWLQLMCTITQSSFVGFEACTVRSEWNLSVTITHSSPEVLEGDGEELLLHESSSVSQSLHWFPMAAPNMWNPNFHTTTYGPEHG